MNFTVHSILFIFNTLKFEPYAVWLIPMIYEFHEKNMVLLVSSVKTVEE